MPVRATPAARSSASRSRARSTAAPSGPAIYSDSSRKAYVQHLASFRDEHSLLTVEPYNVEELRQLFADADKNGWFIEAMFLEPVMGEGDPGRVDDAGVLRGRARTDPFARQHPAGRLDPGRPARARRAVDRRLSRLREARRAGHGNLFEGAQRRPVSAVGARGDARTAELVQEGHLRQHDDGESARARCRRPRCSMSLSDDVRQNIRARGREFLDKLEQAQGRTAGPHHQGAGHRPAVLVRARTAVQVLRRRAAPRNGCASTASA